MGDMCPGTLHIFYDVFGFSLLKEDMDLMNKVNVNRKLIHLMEFNSRISTLAASLRTAESNEDLL